MTAGRGPPGGGQGGDHGPAPRPGGLNVIASPVNPLAQAAFAISPTSVAVQSTPRLSQPTLPEHAGEHWRHSGSRKDSPDRPANRQIWRAVPPQSAQRAMIGPFTAIRSSFLTCGGGSS